MSFHKEIAKFVSRMNRIRLKMLGRDLCYKAIVPKYNDYLALQKNKYHSFESRDLKWKQGQEFYCQKMFLDIPKNTKIADIACGDGVGLKWFKDNGFTDITGVELNTKKAFKAIEATEYKVIIADMHDLSEIASNGFDIVYSSHTLEHAYFPSKVITEFYRILKPNGLLHVVLPYPDSGTEEAHGGKFELGTNIEDNGKTVAAYFSKHRFNLISKCFDSYREPEIWLTFKKLR